MGPSGTTNPDVSPRDRKATVPIRWQMLLAGRGPSVGHTRPTSHLLRPMWLPTVAVELPFPPHGGPMPSAPATAAVHIPFTASGGGYHALYNSCIKAQHTPKGDRGATTLATFDGPRVWPPCLWGHRGQPRAASR